MRQTSIRIVEVDLSRFWVCYQIKMCCFRYSKKEIHERYAKKSDQKRMEIIIVEDFHVTVSTLHQYVVVNRPTSNAERGQRHSPDMDFANLTPHPTECLMGQLLTRQVSLIVMLL